MRYTGTIDNVCLIGMSLCVSFCTSHQPKYAADNSARINGMSVTKFLDCLIMKMVAMIKSIGVPNITIAITSWFIEELRV